MTRYTAPTAATADDTARKRADNSGGGIFFD
jgi:hypothetical protein